MSSEATQAERAAMGRLRGFAVHLAGYFLVMLVLVPVNFLLNPDHVWFVLPMVAWGSLLAVHAAYAMGLFSAFSRKKGGATPPSQGENSGGECEATR